jgi:hypothetical protein
MDLAVDLLVDLVLDRMENLVVVVEDLVAYNPLVILFVIKLAVDLMVELLVDVRASQSFNINSCIITRFQDMMS